MGKVHNGCMLSLPIGCIKFLCSKTVHHHYYKLGILIWLIPSFGESGDFQSKNKSKGKHEKISVQDAQVLRFAQLWDHHPWFLGGFQSSYISTF
jgi:hypothetical protein